MLREIVLDTETTGLDPLKGDRLVEIGCVELVNRFPTGRSYHQRINPERDVPAEAFAVHGLSTEFLATMPKFTEVVDGFLDFIGDVPLHDLRFARAPAVGLILHESASQGIVAHPLQFGIQSRVNGVIGRGQGLAVQKLAHLAVNLVDEVVSALRARRFVSHELHLFFHCGLVNLVVDITVVMHAA